MASADACDTIHSNAANATKNIPLVVSIHTSPCLSWSVGGFARSKAVRLSECPLALFLTRTRHERPVLLAHRATGNAATPRGFGGLTMIWADSVESFSTGQREKPLFIPQIAACVRLLTRILRRIDLT